MAGPPVMNGPFRMPMFNDFVPQRIRPWTYMLIAFCFQLNAALYAGATQQIMGDTCLMREDVVMVVLCGIVGVNMPFPFLFRFKFRFTNRQLLMNAALVIACCNLLALTTECVPLLCILSYLIGFFRLCGTFECMSNIQAWMTPRRDFSVFFPLLYTVVLGNMNLSPWISAQMTYLCQSWQAMNWLMAGVMLTIALYVYLCTHAFRFMKPLPLFGLDWLGCLLWSALMIEVIFLFNYGEFYNWWDGKPFRTVTFMIPLTLYFALQRMFHIRHPYIEPGAWKYKSLVPLLLLFALIELVSSTPRVLQNAFTGGVLHYGWTSTSVMYLVDWCGTVCGCLFVLCWMKILRQKYTRLHTVGCAAMLAYEVMLYFCISPGVDLPTLYLPAWCRMFGFAIFFTTLTIYLQELMPFQHFFMGLTMLGLVRNGVMETACTGIYSFLLRHNITENLSRGLPYDGLQSAMISIKQLYGATCILGTIALFTFLIWDIQPVRSTLKKMPYWNVVGRNLKKMLKTGKKED